MRLTEARKKRKTMNEEPTEEERYDKERRSLLEQEEETSWYRKKKLSASDNEKEAAEIVCIIREDERDNYFGNRASEAIPGPETLDMGGQFLTNRERIEGSKVYRISKRMPKGAHLHLHFNAELEPERLLQEARKVPNMYIRSTQPLLTEDDLAKTEMVFNVIPDDTKSSNVFLSTYNPEWKAKGSQPWMRWSDFREEFDLRFHHLTEKDTAKQKTAVQPNNVQKNGADEADADKDPPIGLESAEVWLKRKMVLSEDEAYGISQTVNG